MTPKNQSLSVVINKSSLKISKAWNDSFGKQRLQVDYKQSMQADILFACPQVIEQAIFFHAARRNKFSDLETL